MCSLVLEGGAGDFYCRSWSEDRGKLGQAISQLYSSTPDRPDKPLWTEVLPSGLSAIHVMLTALLTQRPLHVVVGDEMYGGTEKVLALLKTLHQSSFSWSSVDIRDHDRLLRMFQFDDLPPSVFLFESCTNPSSQMFDFSLLSQLQALQPDCVFVCDNTWLGPTRFNPLQHGAHVVIESLTKYMSGCSCIGGALVLSREQESQPVRLAIRSMGLFVGSDHCRLFLRELEQLQERVATSSQLALQLAHWLKTLPGVDRVQHCLLSDCPTYPVAQRYLQQGGPSCIWFHLPCSRSQAKQLKKKAAKLSHVRYVTSYGGPDTRLDPWPEVARADLNDFPRGSCSGAMGIWFRLAAGYTPDTLTLVQEDIQTLLSQ